MLMLSCAAGTFLIPVSCTDTGLVPGPSVTRPLTYICSGHCWQSPGPGATTTLPPLPLLQTCKRCLTMFRSLKPPVSANIAILGRDNFLILIALNSGHLLWRKVLVPPPLNFPSPFFSSSNIANMSALLALRGRGKDLQAAHGTHLAVQRADILRPAHMSRVQPWPRFLRIPILTSDSYYVTPHAMQLSVNEKKLSTIYCPSP